MKAIYVRVSTEEQATKGYSIDGQIDECIKKANASDVIKYIDDGWTGEILERPALMKLREDVSKGLIKEIVCYDPDRLSRQLMIQLILDDEFRKNGAKLVFVNGEYANTPEGQMFFQFRGAIAQFEKAKIKERTMGGKRRKAMRGLIVKNDKIYGYDFDRDKKQYVINKEQADVVRNIFDWYTSGKFKGVNSLAHHLTDIGIKTATGKNVWHRQVVKQILMQEGYTGTFYQNKWDTEGHYVLKQAKKKVEYKMRPKEEWLPVKIPAIIDQDVFDHAQKLLGVAARKARGYSKHNYMLSGLVRCGRCGGTMTGRKTTSHGKPFYIYNCRKPTAGAKNRGCGKQISENKLNKYVWEYFSKLLENPEELSSYQEVEKEKQYLIKEMQRVEQEIEKNKKGRKRLITLISLDEDLELEEIKDQIKELQAKENELTTYYKQLEKEVNQEEEHDQNIFELAREVYFAKSNIADEDKKELLQKCIKEVVVTENGEAHIFLI